MIREGWEGLVRGNTSASPVCTPALGADAHVGSATPGVSAPTTNPIDTAGAARKFVPTYGEGELLREGVGEAEELGLRGRYIIRVGWDDVRGWMDQVSI